jgi:hypothetical protein
MSKPDSFNWNIAVRLTRNAVLSPSGTAEKNGKPSKERPFARLNSRQSPNDGSQTNTGLTPPLLLSAA